MDIAQCPNCLAVGKRGARCKHCLPKMKRVIIESPFAGDVERNKLYLNRCVLDSLLRNESPYASHVFFTQFLDDDVLEERALGINAGLAWSHAAELAVVYEDYGISKGMRLGIEYHEKNGTPVEYRRIGKNPEV